MIKTNGEQENRIVEEYREVGREGKKTGERTESGQKETGQGEMENGDGVRGEDARYSRSEYPWV